jgi:hypothetical protein
MNRIHNTPLRKGSEISGSYRLFDFSFCEPFRSLSGKANIKNLSNPDSPVMMDLQNFFGSLADSPSGTRLSESSFQAFLSCREATRKNFNDTILWRQELFFFGRVVQSNGRCRAVQLCSYILLLSGPVLVSFFHFSFGRNGDGQPVMDLTEENLIVQSFLRKGAFKKVGFHATETSFGVSNQFFGSGEEH